MRGEAIELVACHEDASGDLPYERLVRDALRGDPSLFTRDDSVEAAWRIVEPVLGSDTPPIEYEPGKRGIAVTIADENDVIGLTDAPLRPRRQERIALVEHEAVFDFLAGQPFDDANVPTAPLVGLGNAGPAQVFVHPRTGEMDCRTKLRQGRLELLTKRLCRGRAVDRHNRDR